MERVSCIRGKLEVMKNGLVGIESGAFIYLFDIIE